MRRRTGRRGRKVVLEYSVFAVRRGSSSLVPCFMIRAGGVFYAYGRVFVRCLRERSVGEPDKKSQ